MKKLGYFIPAITFTIVYGFLSMLTGIRSIHPFVILWLAFHWIAGVLLNKAMFWGGLFGFIPGACFIYMGTQDTGQIIKETPFGVIILLYYAVCMIHCIYKKKHRNIIGDSH